MTSSGNPLRMHRRKLVKGLGVGVAGGVPALNGSQARRAEMWALWQQTDGQATPATLDKYQPKALTIAELETVRAITGRLIPSDDHGPGAIEAGVFVYIDRALAGPFASALPLYQAGLPVLDAASDGSFANASAADQDALLVNAEKEEIPDLPAGFFATVLEHTRQGMFSDPMYGGNREFIGWDLIRYPGIKLVWTAEDQAIGTDVEPMHISVEKFGGETTW